MIVEKLQLVMGLGGYVKDTNTAEAQLSVLPLILPGTETGFAIDSANNWSPGSAALKGGGTWIDSALFNGRSLTSNTVQNVTETITLQMTESTFALANMRLTALNRFVQNARNYFVTREQIQPVYLEYRARGAPASQYALVYNIEKSISEGDYPSNNQKQIYTVVLTIEREPYWTALEPGQNAALWTYYKLGRVPGRDFTYADLGVDIGGAVAVAEGIVNNKFEWDQPNYVTHLTKNYIEIPAASVPGDYPALAMITVTGVLELPPYWQGGVQVFIARSTKEMIATNHLSTQIASAYNLNAGDCDVNSPAGKATSKTATGSTTGVRSNGSNVTYYNVDCVVSALTGYASTITNCPLVWPDSPARPTLSRQLHRGRYLVFVRGGVTSPGTATNDFYMRFRYIERDGSAGANEVFTNEVLVPSANAANAHNQLIYMGTVDVPINARQYVGTEGYGLKIAESTSDMQFTLDFRNTNATTARTARITDVILIPFDEACSQIVDTFSPLQVPTVYDNTGYLLHGDRQPIAISGVQTSFTTRELRGSPIYLEPNVTQRLYFLWTNTSNLASVSEQAYIKVQIIPRWERVRDV